MAAIAFLSPQGIRAKNLSRPQGQAPRATFQRVLDRDVLSASLGSRGREISKNLLPPNEEPD